MTEYSEQERNEIAWRAATRTRALLPQMQNFARTVTGKPVNVLLSSETSSFTDGQNIYVPVRFEMGLDIKHMLSKCDKVNQSGHQICPACRAAEHQRVLMMHEISHLVFGSFDATYTDILPILSRHKVSRPRKSSRTDTVSALASAGQISPYLQLCVNAVEDVRVDSRMFRIRPGLKRANRAHAQAALDFGVKDRFGNVTQYTEFPYNFQALAFCIVTGRRIGFKHGTFSQEVLDKLENDTKLMEILQGLDTLPGVVEAYERAVLLWLRLKDLGFLLEETKDDAPEPPPPADPEDEAGSDDDSQQSADPSSSDDDDSESGSDESREREWESGLNKDGEPGGSSESPTPSPELPGEESVEDSLGADEADEDQDSDSGESGSNSSSGSAGEESSSEDDGQGQERPSDSGASESEGDGASSGGVEGDAESDSEADQEEQDSTGDESGSGESTDGSDGSDSGSESGSDSGREDGDTSSGESGQSSLSTGESGNQTGNQKGTDGDERTDTTEEDYDPYDQAEWQDEDEGSSGDRPSDSESEAEEGGSEFSGSDPQGVSGRGSLAASDDVTDGSGEPSAEDWDGEYRPTKQEIQADESADPELPDGDGGELGSGPTEVGALPLLTPEEKWAAYRDRFGSEEETHDLAEGMMGHAGHQEANPFSEERREIKAIEAALNQGENFDTRSDELAGVYMARSQDRRTWGEDFDLGGYESHALAQNASAVLVRPSVLASSVGALRKVFEKNEAAAVESDLKRGRIDARVIGRRVPVGDMRLYKQRTVPGRRDYVVVLMWDTSGSNCYNHRLEQAKSALMAQADLLAQLGIPFEVYAHTGGQVDTRSVAPLQHTAYISGHGSAPEMLVVIPVKTARDSWNNDARQRLLTVPAVGANLDGHALEFARKHIQRIKAQKKLIMYFTDGDMPAHHFEEELHILRRELATCKELGIAIAGVGVHTDSPSAHGLPTVRFNSEADIPKVIEHIATQLAAI